MAGGDIAKALAGGAAPYLAEEIHKRTTTGDQVNIPANLMAHAVVNAALSLAKGENALAGASSAVTAEAVGLISQAYYGKKASELDESQKQTISALASLAAGLAGGLVGGDTASAVSGMQTGKVTVENNALSGLDGFGKGLSDYGQAQFSLGTSMIKSGTSPDDIAAALSKAAKGDMPEGQNAAEGLLVAWGNFFGVPLDVVMSNEQMTPQKAAEILSSGVPTSEAKLLQYVAAKAFLTISKSTTVKAETGNSLIYHENFGGHAIEKHVAKSDAELIARFKAEPRLNASSTFFNTEVADKAIGNGISANQKQLADWLSGDQARLVLQHEEKFNVGKVIHKGDSASQLSNKLTIVIDRDPLMPNGYRIHTAYPK